jgi:hypothetical protein
MLQDWVRYGGIVAQSIVKSKCDFIAVAGVSCQIFDNTIQRNNSKIATEIPHLRHEKVLVTGKNAMVHEDAGAQLPPGHSR